MNLTTRPTSDDRRNHLCFYMDRERGRGDPISVTIHHHPHKKHFGKPADLNNYDPAKPHMPLPKVKLHLSEYSELDPYIARDTEFIINVPFQKSTGDFIEVMIGDKVISVQIPRLGRKLNRFIVCFIG